jgi:hypothetical protein
MQSMRSMFLGVGIGRIGIHRSLRLAAQRATMPCLTIGFGQ